MLEIPEAVVLAKQVQDSAVGKTVQKVIVGQSPHSFAWYSGDADFYEKALVNKPMDAAICLGGMVELQFQDQRLVFSDGINLRYHNTQGEQPAKHQLLLVFTDDSCISASVAMYGGLTCFQAGKLDNPYYQAASEKPSPLSEEFAQVYFLSLFTPEVETKSVKAFLATEQRIPGLGNGVLQDILFLSALHPKRKVNTLSLDERNVLFSVIKRLLQTIAAQGGRDTEKDLFGQSGGYKTLMSKHTVGKPCTKCGSEIQKQSYMGGSIYFCPVCQPYS